VADDRSIARLVETLQEPVQLDPGFDGRVMAAIEALPAHEGRAATGTSLTSWLRRRTIRLSPLGATGLAAGIAALALMGGSIAGRERAPSGTPAEQVQMTQFVLVAPSAKSVAVVGDFNDWNLSATPLAREAGDGMWWVTLPLSPGRYRYAFVVDGTHWEGDPDAPVADDEFGRPSSVVSIGGVGGA
jgi:hypothetical protein